MQVKLTIRRVAAPFLCVALGACHFSISDLWHSRGAPTGQVVATVGSHEITQHELQAELAGVAIRNPKDEKAAEQAALQNIVRRKILANEAQSEGIDSTPDFELQRQRAIDTVLIQDLEAKIAASVPPPSRDEAERFVVDHPDIFSERKIFSVEQIQMVRPSNPKIIREMGPLKTLDEVEALLTREKVPHRRGQGTIDAVGEPPALIDAIVKLPPGDVFIVPAGNGLAICQIKSTQVVPFTGKAAIKYALTVLKNQHAQEAVKRAMLAAISKGASSVRYNKAYAPSTPRKAAAH